jgi:DNA-binding LacI/PurR family transcriptional regulator
MDMRDIAKLAGVSSATVSRVINQSATVRPDTATRVQRVIDQLKFYPNSSATTLKHGKSSTYGLIIPDITNPFFPELIRSFEKILVDNNREMLMATTDFHASRIQQSIRRMLVRRVDGVALIASEIETEPIEALIHNRVPLVTMDRLITGPGLSDVKIDNRSGMDQAIKFLKEFGHTEIGFIGGMIGPTISDHRSRAFIKTMTKQGLQVNPEFVRAGNYRIPGGEAAMTEMLLLPSWPTAILTANDLTAIGALRAIHRHNLTVPGDISVIGFDDIELSDILHPPLTTLRLSRHELAEQLFGALEAMREEPNVSGRQYSIKTSLVIRESVGPVRKTIGRNNKGIRHPKR